MTVTVGGLLSIFEEDILLLEFAATESEIGVEVPVLILHGGTNARIRDCSATLQRCELRVVQGCISHEAGSNGKFHLFLLVFYRNRGLCVKVLCREIHGSHRHGNNYDISFHNVYSLIYSDGMLLISQTFQRLYSIGYLMWRL